MVYRKIYASQSFLKKINQVMLERAEFNMFVRVSFNRRNFSCTNRVAKTLSMIEALLYVTRVSGTFIYWYKLKRCKCKIGSIFRIHLELICYLTFFLWENVRVIQRQINIKVTKTVNLITDWINFIHVFI